MARRQRDPNFMTQGVIWKGMLTFFFPILLGTFFQQLYNTVDALVVGRFVGTQALAAVGGSAAQISHLIVNFFAGVAGGASVIVSQYYGARDNEGVSKSVHTAIVFAFFGGMLMGILGLLAAPMLLKWMNTPSDIIEQAGLYLKIVFVSVAPMMLYNIGSGILRAVGDSKRPLYYLICCCLTNIVLDLVFVLWLNMGVAGVAIATSLAQTLSAVLVLRALLKTRENYRLEWKKLQITGVMLKKTMSIGIPAGMTSCMYSLSTMIITTSVNALGTATVAAWVAWGKVDVLNWLIVGSLGMTMATFAGQNYGAHLYKRVKQCLRTCMIMSLCFTWAMGAIFLIFARPLVSVFTDDQQVIETAVYISKFFAPFYWLFIPYEMIANTMRGMGKTLLSTCINALGICGVRVFWMLVIVPVWPSLASISLSYPISWFLTMVAFIIYYLITGRRMLREDSALQA